MTDYLILCFVIDGETYCVCPTERELKEDKIKIEVKNEGKVTVVKGLFSIKERSGHFKKTLAYNYPFLAKWEDRTKYGLK